MKTDPLYLCGFYEAKLRSIRIVLDSEGQYMKSWNIYRVLRTLLDLDPLPDDEAIFGTPPELPDPVEPL